MFLKAYMLADTEADIDTHTHIYVMRDSIDRCKLLETRCIS